MPLRAMVVTLLACVALAPSVQAQVTGRPTPRPVAPASRGDTLRPRPEAPRAKGDTTPRQDSLATPTFAAPDSVMQRLLSLPGYTVTRYQGSIITFDALTRAMQLTQKAIVERDSQLVRSDTISYNGSGSSIRVGTDRTKRGNVFIAPGQAPILSSGTATYDLLNKRASVAGLKTQIPQSGETLTITGERVTVAASQDSIRSANDATYYLSNGTVTACDDSVVLKTAFHAPPILMRACIAE